MVQSNMYVIMEIKDRGCVKLFRSDPLLVFLRLFLQSCHVLQQYRDS
jgi:hypothetical protein